MGNAVLLTILSLGGASYASRADPSPSPTLTVLTIAAVAVMVLISVVGVVQDVRLVVAARSDPGVYARKRRDALVVELAREAPDLAPQARSVVVSVLHELVGEELGEGGSYTFLSM